MKKMLQLSNKAYCAGVILNAKGVCIDAAPILRWMIGKGEKWIIHYCRKHHIHVQTTSVDD